MKNLKSYFDFEKGKWNTSIPCRIGRHNLVYKTPPEDAMEGFALGNGELGALLWFDKSQIIIVLNKSDLWEESNKKGFVNWKAREEDKSTTLRHGCRIIIDFNLPIFETIYLNDFRGILDISKGNLKINTKSPFGSLNFSAFIDFQSDILACRLEPDFKNNISYDIKVERYGSRTFSHWYYLVNRDASIGLEGTKSYTSSELLAITHRLNDLSFAAGASMPKGKKTTPNDYTAKSTLNSDSGRIDFFASITSPIAKNAALDLLKQQLETAEGIGYDKLLKRTQNSWSKFWSKSFIDTSDDYLDNLWHLSMYYMRCCQGGKYPGRFINGLWGWYHDAQPWNFYFHWNQQCLYWGLNAAGHHELLNSYLEYRFNSLKYAKEDAAKLHSKNGAFVSDVTDKDGKNSSGEVHNYTPVAQIALEFWKQYRYTGDKKFLKKCAIPYIYEACLLFFDLFKIGQDGLFHPVNSCGFEGWIKLKDSIAMICCGKSLFQAACQAFEEVNVYAEFSAKIKYISDNMCPLPTFDGTDKLIASKDGKLTLDRGMFKGDCAENELVLAAGFSTNGDGKAMSSVVPADDSKTPAKISLLELLYKMQRGENLSDYDLGDMSNFSGIHSASENAAVFPAASIGLKDKGKPIFKAAVNTAKLYAPEMLGWDSLPIMMARLGLGREMFELLQGWCDRWLFNPNGFSHYGAMQQRMGEFFFENRTVLTEDVNSSKIEIFSDVGNVERGKTIPWKTWNFRHLGMESLGVIACAINESLLVIS